MINSNDILEEESVNNSLLIGIDFGTTNTILTYFNDNKISKNGINKINIINDGISNIIPTKVGFYNNKVYCGNYIPNNCINIYKNFKLNIGDNDDNNDINNLICYFFKYLYNTINKFFKLEKSIIKCVITCPSNFNDYQRKILKSILENVGFIVLRIINEPSAAAIAYGLNYSANIEERILVLDIGGGTTDITVLEKTDLFFEVIHSDGLNDLGGNNFTELIYNDIYKNDYIIELFNKNLLDKNCLWNYAQTIKENLSYFESYNIDIKGFYYTITRLKFEYIIEKFINRINSLIIKTINNYPNINFTILVGGSNKIPTIQNMIKIITNNKFWIYPEIEFAIAHGAGLYAGILENKFENNLEIVLLDVLPISLGVELADGTYSIIIPKNTPLPIIKNQKYTTNLPNDNIINIKIYQGDRKIANKNLLLDEIIFEKVSTGSMPVIDITFKVDLNSIITILIKDRKSGNEDTKIINNKLFIKNYNNLELDDTIDDNEIIKLKTLYQIKTFIQNCLNNLNNNYLILDIDKNSIIDEIISIDKKINNMNNLELLNILKYLEENYIIIGSTININKDSSENFFEINKISDLLPTEIQHLQNEELNNITFDNNICYKKELYDLCLFLQSKINSNEIIVDENKNIIINNLITKTLLLFDNSIICEESSTNENNYYWYNEINIFNEACSNL
jgi:molecular chaperone DnaK